jgi:hypothetical protein
VPFGKPSPSQPWLRKKTFATSRKKLDEGSVTRKRGSPKEVQTPARSQTHHIALSFPVRDGAFFFDRFFFLGLLVASKPLHMCFDVKGSLQHFGEFL